MLQKFAMVKYGVFVAKICKHALCASTVRDIWWSPLARQLLPPWRYVNFFSLTFRENLVRDGPEGGGGTPLTESFRDWGH